jgi:hypothetical protein
MNGANPESESPIAPKSAVAEPRKARSEDMTYRLSTAAGSGFFLLEARPFPMDRFVGAHGSLRQLHSTDRLRSRVDRQEVVELCQVGVGLGWVTNAWCVA